MNSTSAEATRPSSALSLSRQELALIAVTFVWGGTFLAVHIAMRHAGPLFFVGIRFVIAGLLALMLSRRRMAGLTRLELGAGAAIGVSIVLGYGLQSYGLQTISSSKSAFITAMYVPMVPLLLWLVLRRPPHYMAWIGVASAFFGLVLMAGPDAGKISLTGGEMATLVGTLAIAAEIILIGQFAGRVDSQRITVVQLLVAGVLSLALMPMAGEQLPAFSWVWVVCAVGLGLASAVIQLTMNWAQKSVSPTRATVIYAGEPVWAGLVGRLAGDRLPALALLGAAFIVIGVIVSELRPGKSGSQPKT
ncbi:DMT family transporter [Variovorax sp. J22R133]|uniref:DMT family transporter n=1 Tax=Variovorax brevis TaxID=3053503 RepID=UPI002576ECE1|nr:DMT family transporter [Variovorax sp. J22R133]MDM0111265.1 DMT family transporter [Variovorax sp. J22R133]